jgi:hypothetical protein
MLFVASIPHCARFAADARRRAEPEQAQIAVTSRDVSYEAWWRRSLAEIPSPFPDYCSLMVPIYYSYILAGQTMNVEVVYETFIRIIIRAEVC